MFYTEISLFILQVLTMMAGNNITDIQLQEVINKTFLFAGKDRDGTFSFDEFCSLCGNTNIDKIMVVNV